jgi:hypothetical protein
MGAQKNRTKVVPATSEVQWNATMQFLIKDLEEDVLCITVFDRGHFSPNGKQINIMKFLCPSAESACYDSLYELL